MSILDTLKLPEIPSSFTHKLKDKIIFIKSSQTGSAPKTDLIVSELLLEKDEQIVLIDYGLGFDAKWSKVRKNDNSFGFTLTEFLEPLSGVKPLLPISKEPSLQPDNTSPKIDWTVQEINKVIDDRYNGNYIIHYDSGVQDFPNKETVVNDIKQQMSICLHSGSVLILKDQGKVHTAEEINRLQNDYFSFAKAESIFFPIRPCSTLRVLVTIPKRLVEALNDVSISPFEIVPPEIQNPIGPTGIDPRQLPVDAVPPKEEDQYINLEFGNYSEYSDFFTSLNPSKKSLRFVLEAAKTIFEANTWTVIPSDVFLNMQNEISILKRFVEKIDQFIFLNIPKGKEKEIKKTGSFLNIDEWNGSLRIVISRKNLNIVFLEFKDTLGAKISFKKGVEKFLSDDDILNKTIINYTVRKFLENNNFAKEILDFSSIGGALSSILVTNLDEGNTNNPLISFLINNHYPKINNLIAQPLNLANCAIEEKNLILNIKNSKAGFLKNQVQQNAGQIALEVGLAREGAQSIDNKNIRILLGLDKIDEDGNPYTVLNKTLAALSVIDVDRLITEFYKYSSGKINVQDYRRIIDNYKNAKNIIDSATFSAVCNPYVTKALKTIQGFSLPTLPIYNPHKNLAQELSNLVIKIINEIVILTIRAALAKSLEAAIKGLREDFLNAPPISNGGNSASSNLDAIDGFINNDQDDTSDKEILDSLATDDQKRFNKSDSQNEVSDGTNQPTFLKTYDLRNFIGDITCVLSLQEFCKLLNGRSVNDDAIDIVKSIVNNKYPELKLKLATKTDIINFFIKLSAKIDPAFCDSIDQLNPQIPINPLCDDGTIRDARKKLLENKNLTEDLVNDLLDGIRQKETDNFEDINRFLNGDAFDFENIPSILCKTGENGEVIKPSVDTTAPLADFNDTMKALMNNAYNVFDSEQERWYQTTYTLSSSTTDYVLEKDRDGKFTGKITGSIGGSPKTTSVEPFFLLKSQNKPITYTETIFANITTTVENPRITYFNFLKNDGSYEAKINGTLQQQFDLNIVTEEAKKQINSIEQDFYSFANELIGKINLKLLRSGAGIIEQTALQAQAGGELPAPTNSQQIDTALNNLQPTLKFFENVSLILNNTLTGSLDQSQLKIFFDSENGKNSLKLILDEMVSKIQDFTIVINYVETNTLQPNLLTKFNNIITKYTTFQQILQLAIKSLTNYPDYTLTSSFESKILDQKYYDVSNLQINKNNFNFIKLQSPQEISQDIVDYVKNELKLDISSSSKQQIFNAYFKKINPSYNELVNSKFSYLNLARSSFRTVAENILNSSFFSVKRSDSGGEVPVTAYLKLKVDQTPEQVQCGIRPHYLDLDQILQQASKNKENTFCIETVINEKIQNNEPFNTQELQEAETTETENIMLNAFHNAYIRTVIHDIILRGIVVFGKFDPQEIRREQLIVDFIYELLRYETKVIDNTYFNILSSFYVKSYKQRNKNTEETDELIVEKVLKDIIKKELKDVVLPKLAKRIIEDTNDVLNLSNINKINLTTLDDLTNNIFGNSEEDLLLQPNPITLEEKNINLITSGLFRGRTTFYLYYPDRAGQFKSSIEYKLLFEFLFPLKKYLSILLIDSILCNMAKKQNTTIFNGTKKEFIRLSKTVLSKGQPINADLNNLQDTLNTNEVDLSWYIIKALLSTPLKIAKGFIEAVDPNISIASKSYAGLKLLDDRIGSEAIPALSFLINFFIPINPLLGIPYYGLFLWYEGRDDKEDKKNAYIVDALRQTLSDPNSLKDCSMVKNNDVVAIDPLTGVYNIKGKT